MASIPDSSVRFETRTPAWWRRSVSPAVLRALAIAGLVLLGLLWGAAVAVAGAAAALICISVIACIFCVRDFRFGVVLLIAIMPISSSNLFPHSMFGISGLNPLNLLLLTTLASYLLATLGHGALKGVISRPLAWLYIVPIIAGGLLGMGHVGQIPPIFKTMDWIEYDNATGYLRDVVAKPLFLVLYALLVAVALRRSRAPERFLNAMLLSMWVMGGIVIVYVASSGISLGQLAGQYSRSFFSPLGMHANDLGRLYASAYALLLFIWDRTARPGLKTMMLVSMGIVFIALVLTFSRGAFFAFVMINAIYLFSRRRIKTLLLASLAIPAALVLAPGALWSRLSLGLGQGADAVTAGRTGEIWLPLVPDLLQSPVWGHGLQSILWSQAMRSGRILEVTHPHSAFLQAILDLGVIGLFLMLAFWLGHVWRNFRRLARDPGLSDEMGGFFEGAAAGLVAIIVANVAGSSFFPVPEQSFTWLAVGMMYGMRLRERAAQG